MQPKILFTTPILAYPASGGPMLRIQNSIKALARVSELHVLSQVPQQELGTIGEQHYRTLTPHFSYVPFANSSDATLRAQNADHIARYCQRHQISIVWLGYGNISYPLLTALKQIAPNLKLICDTDAVWSRFVARELPFCSDPARRHAIQAEAEAKAREEEHGANIADITTAVSGIDAEYYRSISTYPERVHLFSNVIDLAEYRNTPPLASGIEKPYLYLAGSFYSPHAPMTEAARWFLANVWPVVHHAMPEASCVILGRGADRELAGLHSSGIKIQGYVDSVLPYLCHAAAAIVPLHFESGTRFKILEAAACRIPVVSTILGAEGIPVTHGKDILIADEPRDFAQCCLELLRTPDRGQAMAEQCYQLVAAQNSVETLAKQALDILNVLGEYSRSPCATENSPKVTSALSSQIEIQPWKQMEQSYGVPHTVRSALTQIVDGKSDDKTLLYLSEHAQELYQILPSFPSWIPDHLVRAMEELTTRYRAS